MTPNPMPLTLERIYLEVDSPARWYAAFTQWLGLSSAWSPTQHKSITSAGVCLGATRLEFLHHTDPAAQGQRVGLAVGGRDIPTVQAALDSASIAHEEPAIGCSADTHSQHHSVSVLFACCPCENLRLYFLDGPEHDPIPEQVDDSLQVTVQPPAWPGLQQWCARVLTAAATVPNVATGTGPGGTWHFANNVMVDWAAAQHPASTTIIISGNGALPHPLPSRDSATPEFVYGEDMLTACSGKNRVLLH